MKRMGAEMPEWLNGGRTIELAPLNGRGMPPLYRGCYAMAQGEMDGMPVVVARDRHAVRLTPGSIAKHMEGIAALTGKQAVYAADTIAAQDARRMVARGVAFMGGNGNVFLPFMALRLTGKPKPAPAVTKLGVPAQLLLLGMLNHRLPAPLAYGAAESFLPYSRGSIHAAFEQLQLVGLCRRLPGRAVQLEPVCTGRALWERALPLLQNPCRRTIEAPQVPEAVPCVTAGETALAALTMLAAPPQAAYACALHDFLRLPQKPHALPAAGEPIVLQLWLYPPCLPGTDGIDALSLYLSLRHLSDERVQQALEQLLDDFPW